jgi:hypothetical protein
VRAGAIASILAVLGWTMFFLLSAVAARDALDRAFGPSPKSHVDVGVLLPYIAFASALTLAFIWLCIFIVYVLVRARRLVR